MAFTLPCSGDAGKIVSTGPCIGGIQSVEILDADCSTYFISQPCGGNDDRNNNEGDNPCSGGYVRSAPGTSSGWNCPSGTANVIYWYDECGNVVDEIFQSCVPPIIPPVTPPVTPPITPPVVPPITPPVSPPRTPPVVPPVVPPVTPPPPVVPPITPPPVTPPVTPPAAPKPPAVKSAIPDYVAFPEDTLPSNIIADILFENIGGQELLSIARYDTVNGQPVLYQPIKNLDILQQKYNPNNLIKLQGTSDVIFNNFPILLEQKIPNVGSGANATNMYIDSSGSLVIEFVGLRLDELVEVQISFDGTIYEVGI